MLVVVDVTTLKMARKPVKLQKENPAKQNGHKGKNKNKINDSEKSDQLYSLYLSDIKLG